MFVWGVSLFNVVAHDGGSEGGVRIKHHTKSPRAGYCCCYWIAQAVKENNQAGGRSTTIRGRSNPGRQTRKRIPTGSQGEQVDRRGRDDHEIGHERGRKKENEIEIDGKR